MTTQVVKTTLLVLVWLGPFELACRSGPSASDRVDHDRTQRRSLRQSAAARKAAPDESTRADAGLHQYRGFGIGRYRSTFPRGPMAPLLGMGPGDPAPWRCQRDGDCLLTRHLDGQCCGSSCSGAGSALNADFEARLRAHLKQHCAGQSCPIVDCSPGPPNQVWHARCRQGRCEAVQEPLGMPDGARRERPSAQDLHAFTKPLVGTLKQCLARAGVPPNLPVSVRIRLAGPTGRVERVTVLRAGAPEETAPATPLSRCLLDALRRGHVPPFKAPDVVFYYPLMLRR